jgi:hypothetical protein
LIVANKTRGLELALPSISGWRHKIHNSTIVHNFVLLATRDEEASRTHGHQSQVVRAEFENVRFMERIPAPTPNPLNITLPFRLWYISIDPKATKIPAPVYIDGPYVRWDFPPAIMWQTIV